MEIGLSIHDFDYITPSELRVMVEAYNKNVEHGLYLAWLNANLSKAQKMPNFSDIVPKKKLPTSRKVNKYQMQDYEIEQHLNMYKRERRLLLIG